MALTYLSLLLIITPLLLAGPARADTATACSLNTTYADAKTGSALAEWLANNTAAAPQQSNTSVECRQALQNLTVCTSDGASLLNTTESITNISSLTAADCCSKPCEAAVRQAIVTSGPGCYRSFLQALCSISNSTTASNLNSSLVEPLLSLSRRCIGVNATCGALNQSNIITNLVLPGSQPGTAAHSSISSTTGSGSGIISSSSSSDATNATSEGEAMPIPPPAIPVPDPYGLVPPAQQQSNVVLASTDEIEAAAAARTRAGRRRLRL